jgi:type II restriction enzyme
MTWDSELEQIIKRHWRPGQDFTLDEVYRHEPHFSRLYPNNRHRLQKLRQTLQHLRDQGVLEFVDDQGRYKRLR